MSERNSSAQRRFGLGHASPFFGVRTTYQLVINTGTTIITLLMVFDYQIRETDESVYLLRALPISGPDDCPGASALPDQDNLQGHETTLAVSGVINRMLVERRGHVLTVAMLVYRSSSLL